MSRLLATSLAVVCGIGCGDNRQAVAPPPPTFSTLELETAFYAEGAAAGDIDRDGIIDVIYGPHWYRGPEFDERFEIYAPVAFDKAEYSDNFFCYTDDFNSDGWPDILVLGFPGRAARWYENPRGTWQEHWRVTTAFTAVDNESPTFADVTGDGVAEIVFHSGGRIGWASRAADPYALWEFSAISPALGYARFTHGLGVGDVDGDGRTDILEKSGWWQQSTDGQSPWTKHDVAFSGGGGAQMHVYDFDNDGDSDIVASVDAHGWGLSWYEQTSSGSFSEHAIMDPTGETTEPYGARFSQLHALAMADMDGDGVLDIVTGKRHYAHGAEVDPEPNAPAVTYAFLTRRRDDGVTFEPLELSTGAGVGTDVRVADLSGDGQPDVVVGNKLGLHVLIAE